MPGDKPLQDRSGYNQGQQPLPLTGSRFLGQPAVKCGAGDTVLFRQASVSPGENNTRTLGSSPLSAGGFVFNRTGGGITVDLVLVDPNGNEFLGSPGAPVAIANNQQLLLQPSPVYYSAFPLKEGWTVKLRIFTGDPTAGQGVIAWPWAHDKTRNYKSFIEPLTTTTLEIGPPKGRAWQTAGSASSGLAGNGHIYYANFDSVDRTVTDEILHLAGEDIKINSGVVNVTQHVDVDSGIEKAYQDETDLKENGLIIAYPDTLKFKAGENQTSAPLYLVATFAEFDLPKDQG